MFKLGQKLFYIKSGEDVLREIVPCVFVCDVVDKNGDFGNQYAVKIKENTVTILYSYEIFETKDEAVNKLLKEYTELIESSQKRIKTLTTAIETWKKEKCNCF